MIFFSLLSLMIQGGFSQGITPGEWGLKSFKIDHETLGGIHYYVTESGTSGLPTMLIVKSGGKSPKAGTPFCNTVEVEEIDPMRNLEEYSPSDEYIQKADNVITPK